MFKIIQSNDITVLADHLSELYQHDGRSIFEPFVVITPAKVLGEWLEKYIAKRTGVSTLMFAQFWGQYQWTLVQNMLNLGNDYLARQGRHAEQLFVPEVAMLSQSVIRWRIFAFLLQDMPCLHDGGLAKTLAEDILEDENHSLHSLIVPIAEGGQVPHHRLWQLAKELAAVYVKYLTLRPNWLTQWAEGEAVDVPQMIAQKDKMESFYHYYAKQYEQEGDTPTDDAEHDTAEDAATPAWLFEHYVMLETALRYLWQVLFAESFVFRERLEERFWQIVAGEGLFDGMAEFAKEGLPKQLYLFTVQQIPPVELAFLQRLSRYMDVVLLHLNPSAEFWADTVDKQWLLTQRLIRADSVYLREYGHGLLSRLGKESRQTFAMLADMSGGENFVNDNAQDVADTVIWEDKFRDYQNHQGKNTLLNQLKQDILLLDESGVQGVLGEQIGQSLLATLNQKTHQSQTTWQLSDDDDSLSIHSCHSLKRQLEVLRLMIVRWLNTPSKDGSARQLSDIAVFLPDMEASSQLVSAVFPNGRGIDGFYLPAKITGIATKSVGELWQAISGFFDLIQTRFYYAVVCDWLMLPALYESFGLDFDGMSRACELLQRAGFVRGFDAEHLQQELYAQDDDYRYTFAFAIDRIVTGLLLAQTRLAAMFYPFEWQTDGKQAEFTEALDGVRLADAPIIEALCAIFLALKTHRHTFSQKNEVTAHLAMLENEVIKPYFDKQQGTPEMLAVFTGINGLLASIRASSHDRPMAMNLPFGFVLESVGDAINAQQISSEPSGVITFGRFGSLRSIAFELVVMLDMNLASLPRGDYHNRLDLTRAGMRQRGDRLNEDDDNGAFLEALLSAQEACWIFYTGQASDGTVLLPANPVSELINFLTHEPRWVGDVLSHEKEQSVEADDTAKDEADDTNHTLWQALPRLIEEWLITKHTATPFEKGLFEVLADKHSSNDTADILGGWLDDAKENKRRQLPPPAIWQQVYHTLKQTENDAKNPPNIITLPKKEELADLLAFIQTGDIQKGSALMEYMQATDTTDTTEAWKTEAWTFNLSSSLPSNLQVARLAGQIANPADTFLSGKIAIMDELAQTDIEEPLSLDALDDWILTDTLLNHGEAGALYYGDGLPAGVGRLTAIDKKQKQIHQLKSVLMNNLLQIFGGVFDETQFGEPDFTHLINPVLSHKTMIHLQNSEPSTEQGVVLQSVIPIQMEVNEQDISATQGIWRNISASKLRAKHLLRAWLMHVYWQMVRKPCDTPFDGVSIWQFLGDGSKHISSLNGAVAFLPISAAEAYAELQRWLRFLAVIKDVPVALTASNALIYLANRESEEVDLSKLFAEWHTLLAHLSFVPEENSKHPAWQKILGQNDPMDALMDTFDLTQIYQVLLEKMMPMPHE